MKKLPIGIQSFEDLRSNGYLYVDKTDVIHRIVSSGKVYFLSRPRRFGKSLLISALDALFRGREELFRGLYIHDKWNWTEQYPVVRIDWTQINHATVAEMKISMIGYLKEIAQSYQVTLSAQSAPDCFRELIKTLYEQTGKKRKVVILIDEYDKPVTSHLYEPDLKKIQDTVHDFYQVMKGADEYIKFIFLTGVSKFSGLSIFSALNNPDDITISNRFASLCGYTQEELESNFSEYIDNAAEYLKMTREYLLEQIRYWYNGYTWDGTTAVYNPFSTLKFFAEREFTSYWFDTGTPTFLIDIIQRRNSMGGILEPIVVDNNIFKGYNPSNISEVPLLFQTGYLTIKQKELINGVPRYTLGIPNSEVNDALLTCLVLAYGKYSDMEFDEIRRTMQHQITACDESGFAHSLEVMIATVPSELHVPCEHYYHSLMLIWMRLIGFKIRAEEHTSIGRSDAVWEQSGFTVVAEVKYSPPSPVESGRGRGHAEKTIDALLKEAMAQIHEKRYYNKYTGKVLLLGIAFSGRQPGCRMEVLNRHQDSVKFLNSVNSDQKI